MVFSITFFKREMDGGTLWLKLDSMPFSPLYKFPRVENALFCVAVYINKMNIVIKNKPVISRSEIAFNTKLVVAISYEI